MWRLIVLIDRLYAVLMKLVLVGSTDTMRIYPRYCMMNHRSHYHHSDFGGRVECLLHNYYDCVNDYVTYQSQDEEYLTRAYPRYSDTISVFAVAVLVGAVRLLSCPCFFIGCSTK